MPASKLRRAVCSCVCDVAEGRQMVEAREGDETFPHKVLLRREGDANVSFRISRLTQHSGTSACGGWA